MGRLRKAIFNGGVYFITTSVETGVMLPANPLVSMLVKSAMQRAFALHPVKISHLIVNGTHLHLMIRCYNPEDIPGFMERFKTESSHYLNKLLGRKKRTIWCDSYDCSRILTPGRAIEKIVYLYTNPVKDGLISSIKNYPGISSWNHFKSQRKSHLRAYKIKRADIFSVNQNLSYNGYKSISKKLIKLSDSKEKVLPILDANDWMKGVFRDSEGCEYTLDLTAEEVAEYNQNIMDKIELREQEISQEKTSFMGRTKLENQGIDLEYDSPNRKRGRKLWCESDCVKTRIHYISYVKSLVEEAREVYECWKCGDYTAVMPAGLFAPNMPRRSNLIFA